MVHQATHRHERIVPYFEEGITREKLSTIHWDSHPWYSTWPGIMIKCMHRDTEIVNALNSWSHIDQRLFLDTTKRNWCYQPTGCSTIPVKISRLEWSLFAGPVTRTCSKNSRVFLKASILAPRWCRHACSKYVWECRIFVSSPPIMKYPTSDGSFLTKLPTFICLLKTYLSHLMYFMMSEIDPLLLLKFQMHCSKICKFEFDWRFTNILELSTFSPIPIVVAPLGVIGFVGFLLFSYVQE